MWFWPILQQSLQILKVLWDSGLFYELWSLVLIFYWIQVRWLAGHSSCIFFFWNQLRVSLAVFGIIVLVKYPPLFHLHHPGTVGVGTDPANINFHWLGTGLLSNYWFQLVSWLSMPFCTSLSSCVQYFFPVSFHFIMHNLISELICFVFFVFMDYLGCYRHLVKISSQRHR